MQRVNVTGGSGSGKTTVGRALASKLGVPFIEIDQVHWTEPNWRVLPARDLRARMREATSGERWVVDGSYGSVRDIVWSRADTVVWLDLPFTVTFGRILRRTLGRIKSGERLWGVQKETIRGTFFSRDSLLLFALRTHRRRARLYREWLARPEYAHLTVIRLRSQREIDAWLSRM